MTAPGQTTRARKALPHTEFGTGRKLFQDAEVGPDEREYLAAGMGALLRAARVAGGLSVRRLAIEAGASPTTVSQLERGLVRPRPVMLRDIVCSLDPKGDTGLLRHLTELAGESLRPDTVAGLRRRRRRYARAWRSRQDMARQANAHQAAAMRAITSPARMHWKSGWLARTDLNSITKQLAIFEQAKRQHDYHRAAAKAITAKFREPVDVAAVRAAVDEFLRERCRLARA